MKSVMFVLISLFAFQIQAQVVELSGFIIDDQNNRKLDEVELEFTSEDAMTSPIKTMSDMNGFYKVTLPKQGNYSILLERTAFYSKEFTLGKDMLQTANNVQNLSLSRLPGYEFEATVKAILGEGSNRKLGEELKNLRIEIFNNTSNKEVKIVEDDPKSTFSVNFERGNHYTMLIRKKKFFAKRVEIFVDIEGCILCFEGIGSEYAPEIESASTGDNSRISLIGDIPMRKIVLDEAIKLDNIFYDYNKWNIRTDAKPALDKLVRVLKRNPVTIELGSHTDSRGKDAYNQTLSEKRAQSAVDYIVSRGIKTSRIVARGYGESIPVNKCVDDVTCTDAEYQENRRTEFKVTAFIEGTSFDNKTLKQILEEEKLNNKRAQETLDIDKN